MFRRISPLLLWTVVIPALAGIYVGAAKLGLSLATTAEQVTAVWPPTGIALAAVLLFGYRVWPAIAIGAFVTNVTTSESVATACGIAAGNTLEAILGAWLLQAVAGFDCSLARLKDVIALIVLAAGCSTAVCATIGVTSLCLGGVQPWSHFGSLWGLWWLGDAVGELIVAPLLLTWAVGPGRLRRSTEAAALLALLVAVSWLGFGGQSQESGGDRPWIYCMFPLVMWAALRFGQRGTTIATLVASTLAIWSTVHGFGPFGVGLIHERLLSLQLFVGVVATSALLLSAALAERERLEQELRLRLDQLKDADRRKDEFLAMLAHELRNPLAPIQNALEIIRLPSDHTYGTRPGTRTPSARSSVCRSRAMPMSRRPKRFCGGRSSIWFASSMICSIWPASPAARSSFARNEWRWPKSSPARSKPLGRSSMLAGTN